MYSVLLILFVFLSETYSLEILNLRWGEPPHNINYFTTPDGIYGISDFYADENEIGILNNFNRTVDIFENGNYKYSVENIPEDIILTEHISQKTFLFGRDGSVYTIQNRSVLKTDRILNADGLSGVLIINNLFYPLSRFEKYANGSILMDVIIENPYLAQIKTYDNEAIFVYSIPSSRELAAITPIGFINNLLVIDVEFNKGKERSVITITETGEIISEIILPNRFMLSDIRDIRVFNNNIYILSSDKNGIKIYRYDGYTDDRIEISAWTKNLYEFTGNNSYTENLLALTPVKRSEALALAKEYNDHIWTAKSCNVGTTTCTDWCNKQKTIKPPSWVVVGTNKRFPYSWGGFSTIAQFDQGLTDCKKAGDIQTKYADGTSACG
ncbi:MAG: hypothetical protein N3B13_10980, partial [Deltaproteobacteria bacterium]|nr:hypothetical protein [Deltaproteobacteria bacterium]